MIAPTIFAPRNVRFAKSFRYSESTIPRVATGNSACSLFVSNYLD